MSTDPIAPPAWVVAYDRHVVKQLDQLPPQDYEAIDAALLAMRADPFSGDLEHLKQHHRYSFRRRVRDYRILFNVDHERRRVLVGSVERRTSSTYRKR